MSKAPLTPEQIAEGLRLHGMWWRDEPGGKRLDWSGANLVRAYLAGANLAGANLDRANLAGANLVRANLAGANLVRANLDGANLAGANLVRANLDGANLDGANLAGANLDGANLAGANLDGAKGFLPFVCVGPIGSRRGYTTISLTEDKIQCGCFNGTLAAFEKQVQRTHKNNPLHLAEYTAVATMARALREAQPPREATPEPPSPFAGGQTVQLTEAGRKYWPWAPASAGEVYWCRGGWTRVEFDTCYLSIPDAFVELAEAAVDGASA